MLDSTTSPSSLHMKLWSIVSVQGCVKSYSDPITSPRVKGLRLRRIRVRPHHSALRLSWQSIPDKCELANVCAWNQGYHKSLSYKLIAPLLLAS